MNSIAPRTRTPEVEEDPGPPAIVHEVPSALTPYVRRIVANNPGPMTGPGTNTYLAGIDEIAIIDPGPNTEEHVDAIAGCGGDRIRWILLTHTHEDHWPATAALKARTGAEVCAFTTDVDVPVDRVLAHGDTVESTEFRISAFHTPGHASNHLCYVLEEERILFSGDHIMDGSTVVIAPPDGDMAAYYASLEALLKRRLRGIAPGHGHFITDAKGKINEYLADRRSREAQILDAVTKGESSIDGIVGALYPDLMEELVIRAKSTVWAHLIKLADEGAVTGSGIEGTWATA